MKDDWALVVGINDYPRAVDVKPLKGAVLDAIEFHKWVIDPLGGGVTSPGQAVLLTSPPTPLNGEYPHPALANFTEFFSKLLPLHKFANEPARRLYVFLSGHGIVASGETSLLTAEASQPRPLVCFPGGNWARGLRDGAFFREVVVIMDCCRDLENNASASLHPYGDPVDDAKNNILVEAYATRWASKARELAFPPDDSMRGIFTNSVLAVLRAGRMTGAMFKASVEGHVAYTLRKYNEKARQDTQIKGDPDSALAAVIFNEDAPEPRTDVVISGLAAGQAPEILLFPPGGGKKVPVEVKDWAFKDGAWRCTLPPDKYEIRAPEGDFPLEVHAGFPTEREVKP